jgi:hypothetical protein
MTVKFFVFKITKSEELTFVKKAKIKLIVVCRRVVVLLCVGAFRFLPLGSNNNNNTEQYNTF